MYDDYYDLPTLKSLHWLKVNERIELRFSFTHTKETLSTAPYPDLSVQPPGRTRSPSVVTIARPPSSSSLKITSRSFRYASPSLWNNLPASFRQPRSSSVTTVTHHFLSSIPEPVRRYPPSYPPDCPLDFNRTAFTDFVPLCVMF